MQVASVPERSTFQVFGNEPTAASCLHGRPQHRQIVSWITLHRRNWEMAKHWCEKNLPFVQLLALKIQTFLT